MQALFARRICVLRTPYGGGASTASRFFVSKTSTRYDDVEPPVPPTPEHLELPPHTHLKLPDLGSKGTVLKWLLKPGQAVEEGEPFIDVSFDDFDVELSAEHSGFLAQLLKTEDDGPLEAGTKLAIVVKDVDFVGFFTPTAELDEIAAAEEEETEKAAASSSSSSSSSSSAETPTSGSEETRASGAAAPIGIDAITGMQVLAVIKSMEEETPYTYATELGLSVPSFEEETGGAGEEGDKIATAPSVVPIEPSEREVAVWKALKNLAVNEDETLKRAFFASFPGEEYDAEAFDRREFLDLCSRLIAREVDGIGTSG
jgi:pyruvate/2-oxoglutarate dehydrogenase complex dihydrolipoamide acyltransferase (E2) component